MNYLRIYRYGLLVGLQDFAIFWNWKTWVGGWMFRVFCSAVTWVLLGKVLGSQETLYFLVIGNAVFQGAGAPGTAAACTWDRYDGTYPLLVIAPTSLVPAMVGRTSIWLLNNIATSLAAFMILATVFSVPMPMPQTLFVPFAVAVVCGSVYGLTLFLGAFLIRAPQWRNIVHNVAMPLLMAFCGVTVPMTFWPPWIARLASFLPVTHGLGAIRLLLARGDPIRIAEGIALEVAVGLGWLCVSILVMDWLANLGRADGSIEFV
jgi:ABC-2 type transport system permease protein